MRGGAGRPAAHGQSAGTPQAPEDAAPADPQPDGPAADKVDADDLSGYVAALADEAARKRIGRQS